VGREVKACEEGLEIEDASVRTKCFRSMKGRGREEESWEGSFQMFWPAVNWMSTHHGMRRTSWGMDRRDNDVTKCALALATPWLTLGLSEVHAIVSKSRERTDVEMNAWESRDNKSIASASLESYLLW
jgi:hypothetical protein